jgi:predicted Zn finger-like uncharacterized protein
MKFLCGNCKAKYQIADEKASGKTLRMKCRRCGHDILIDGHNVASSSPPPPSPAPARRPASVVPSPGRGGSGATALPSRPLPTQGLPPRSAALRSKPPAPSTLSSEFRRHIAAPPEVPQRTAPYDLWHAAIKDVPVGPMTREELGRKIEAGAVTEDSLCWREGMDDWRPLGELPELSQLLRRSRDGSRSRPPPRHRPPPHVPPHAAPHAARSPSQYPAELEELEEDYSEPTRIADLSQSMPGLAAAQHAPAHGGTSPKIALPPQAQIAAAMAPSVEAPVGPATRQPAGGWGTMTNGIAIGLLLGILLLAGPMLYSKFWGDAPAAEVAKPVTEQPLAASQPTASTTREPQVEAPAEPDKQEPTAKVVKPVGPGPRNTKVETKEGANGKVLSAEEQALLRRMGVAGGAEIPLPSQKEPGTEMGGAGGGPTLTQGQLSTVVQNNKVQLQRCYETALRAAGGRQEGTIKITVSVTVGMSGTAKSVSTEGNGLGGMTDCIKQSVKRWRFPQSGGESLFAFPLVFQPGA